jgi:diguanylate cyclase (GGDEF)-like protein
MLISSLISFYHGLCDLNLLFQAQHVRSYYLDVLEQGAWNISLNANPSFVIIVFEVFPRSIILLVFTIMMQYTVISSSSDALRIAQLTYLKETDLKTKVYNKTKYQEMIADYYPQIENIAVIFWDLNGLKQINDKYGHAMGDMAISKLSSVLYPYTNDSCRVYRVGGDEFIMILDNPKADDAQRIIKSITQELKASNADSQIEISSAVGHAQGSGKDVLSIVESADASMYENKRYFKEHKV